MFFKSLKKITNYNLGQNVLEHAGNFINWTNYDINSNIYTISSF